MQCQVMRVESSESARENSLSSQPPSLSKKRKRSVKVFNINSRTILPIGCAYIIITAVIVSIFFVSVQNALIKDELTGQLDLAFRNIETGAPMHNVLNNNAYHANYYLSRQLNALEVTSPGRYLKARIIAEEGGSSSENGRYIDTYASWISKHEMLSTACPKIYDRFYSSKNENAIYDFRIFITVDDCYPTTLGGKEMIYLAFGMILMTIFLILPLRVLSHVFTSLRRIEDFMGTSDPEVVESVAKQISIEEIKNLFLRASKLEGTSIFHYKSVMQDVKHNILRILLRFDEAMIRLDNVVDEVLKEKLDSERAMFELANISSDLKKELGQLKSANSQLNKEYIKAPVGSFLSSKEFCSKARELLCVDSVTLNVANVNIHVNFEYLEPAILNLSSNLKSHGNNARAHIALENDQIFLLVTNDISIFKSISFSWAKFTRRIDLKLKEKNVYRKIYGREGLGLNIIKKSALALNGQMVLSWGTYSLTVGLIFPVKTTQIVVGVKREKEESSQKLVRNRKEVVLWLKEKENIEEVYKLGLGSFLKRDEEQLVEMINNHLVQELIVDHDLSATIVYHGKIRRIKNKQILQGFALNLRNTT